MNRTSYLGMIVALGLVMLMGILVQDSFVPQEAVAPEVKALSVEVVPALPPTAPVRVTTSPVRASTTTSTVKAKPKEVVQTVSIPSPNSGSTGVPAVTQASFDGSAAALRGALVNILCYAPAGSGLHSISGSGVFIDPKGIILTNAHIGQYLLFANRGVSCTIRTGSPAVDSYKAAPIYISPEWIRKNSSAITQDAPTGTGEYDFAFLAVERGVKNVTLPSLFPSVPLALTPPQTGAPVVIASYGAQFLETNQIQSSLFPTIVFGSVKDIFTFASSTIDVLALGGSVAAQEGSSGGGVVNVADGTLVGTITTSTVLGPTDTRKLSAITASYIRSEYARETGNSLERLLTMPISEAIADFVPKIPELEAILLKNLSN